jgi:hypothetical protein
MSAKRSPLAEPDWLPGLVVYEISTRNFTSPNGAESGTFASLAERLPSLQELGITGIWLTGHNWADNTHFYGIWTQYATIRPDVIDDRLGTREQFQAMVKAAHLCGIKVFLDVITHGVMKDSPLVKEHPSWFRTGTWGMIDYDWFGDHEDLFRWWIDTWVRYVLEDGIDGYRLDVSMYRPDLWQEIKRKAGEAGHPIIVFHELGPGRRGVVDFLQRDIRMKDQRGSLDFSAPFLMDMHKTITTVVENPTPAFEIAAELTDETRRGMGGENPLRIRKIRRQSRDVRNTRTGDVFGDDSYVLDIEPFIDPATIKNFSVSSGEHQTWMLRDNIAADFTLELLPRGRSLQVRFPARLCPADNVSIQLSCHDDGWDGFPKGGNPYAARGSRFVFGYGFMLTPAVPIFMSGEEFDADFVPLPRLTPGLFGGQGAGDGTWLYGSWLQWNQMDDPRHREMWEDARDIIRIRREFQRLVRPARRESPLRGFLTLDGHSTASLPVPYAYCDSETLLVVAANSSPQNDAHMDITIPWKSLPLRRASAYSVRDVWNAAPARRVARADLDTLALEIRRDRTKKGGLAVQAITPA